MTDTRQTRAGGDHDEIRRAQRGDRAAFLHLYERHAPLTWRLALVSGRDRAAAEAAVVGAFAQVLARPDRRDTHRFAPIGAQLLRSARDAAIEQASRLGEPAGLEAIADTTNADTVCAFDRLPEGWRSALWLDHVEHCGFGTTALVLGTSGPATTALTTRALDGFREQLVRLKVHPAMKSDCRQTTLRLGAYVALALPSRDAVRVRRHLDRCEECRTRLDDLDDVTTHLRGALPALPIAVESLAMGAWLARGHEGAGPLGLRMPGGALAPAWVERSLAGATAAVVSLGITAAVLLNARGGGNPVPSTESAIARAEGEQALAGDDTIDEANTDGGSIVVSGPAGASSGSTSGSDGSTGGSSAPTGTSAGTSASGELPRGDAPTPSSPTQPAPTGSTPTPTPPPEDPPGGSDDQSSTPVDEVVDAVDDVVDGVCGVLGSVCDAAPTEPTVPSVPSLPPLGL